MPPETAVIMDPAAAVVAVPEAAVEAPATAVVEEAAPAAVETPAAPGGLLSPDTTTAEVPTETPAAEASATDKPVYPAAPAVDPAAAVDSAAAPVAEPVVEAAILPTYEPFTLPEGVVVDNEAMGKFTGVIGELGLDQIGGQRLMDLYVQEHGRLVEQMAAHQQQVFEDTQKEWVRQFNEDPELGRNRRDTTLREANTAIRWAFGLGLPGEKLTPEEEATRSAGATKYYTEMSYTGFQNHPENVRAWSRMYKLMSRYLAEPGAPPPGMPPARDNIRPADRRYGPNGAAR